MEKAKVLRRNSRAVAMEKVRVAPELRRAALEVRVAALPQPSRAKI